MPKRSPPTPLCFRRTLKGRGPRAVFLAMYVVLDKPLGVVRRMPPLVHCNTVHTYVL